MIKVEELEEIVRIKDYSEEMQKAARSLGIIQSLPYAYLDWLIRVIEREADLKITKVAVEKLKEKK